MNEHIVIIFKIVVGIASFLAFGIPLGCMYRTKKRTAKIPTISTEELKEMAVKQPLLYCNNVVKELLSRNEDISFTMPLYLKMACNKHLLNRLIGWQGLKVYFPEKLTQLDFSEERPSQKTLTQLKSIESELVKGT